MPASVLRKGDVVVVEAGDVIPGDGEVIEGIASVDESAVTGRVGAGDPRERRRRSAVTGGTKVLSDRIVVRIGVDPGESFLDRMIGLVEGAKRQKTPNEIALHVLLSGMTIIFLIACVTLVPMGLYSGLTPVGDGRRRAARVPDPDHDRRADLRHRHRRHGPPDPPQRHPHERPRGRGGGRRRHDPPRQDRHDHARQPHGDASSCRPPGVRVEDLADAAQLASLADETPEGRSIVVLAKERHGLRGRELQHPEARFVPFSAQTRMSGCDLDGRVDPQGRGRTPSRRHVAALGGRVPPDVEQDRRERSPSPGGTPLAVSDGPRVLGVVHLKDIVKGRPQGAVRRGSAPWGSGR